MKPKLIKTEKEYDLACSLLYKLVGQNPAKGSESANDIEILTLLVDSYQRKHFPIGPPNPIEAINFRMEQMNLKQKDIAPLFGGETRVSEVLNGNRPLNMKMVMNLNKYLKIPFESLIKENPKLKLEPNAKRRLLKNPGISDFYQQAAVG